MAKKNKNNTFYIIGFIILLIVLISVAYFVLHKKNNKAISSSSGNLPPTPGSPLKLSINVLKSFTDNNFFIDISKLDPDQKNIISVDWGDGSGVTTNFSHQYSIPDTYYIKIYGNLNSLDFTNFEVGGTQPHYYIYNIGINAYGSSYNTLQSINFNVSTDITNIPLSLPLNVTKLSFTGSKSICDITKLDVSNITDMSHMLFKCDNFNQDLSGWNVSKVTDMSSMFAGCWDFNKPLNWGNKVSNVTDISFMFSQCQSFNQPLDNWDISNVTNMNKMFYGCTSFKQNLCNWTRKIKNKDVLLQDQYLANQLKICGNITLAPLPTKSNFSRNSLDTYY